MTIPSLNHILLEVAQSLGVELGAIGLGSTRERDRFARSKLSLDARKKKLEELIDEIVSLLGIGPDTRKDVDLKVANWAQYLHTLQNTVWTGNASDRTVLWYLCSHCLAPGLGRELAFWNLPEPFDPGMPSGTFWFLPSLDPGTGKLRLPLQKVVDWLLDLLGAPVDAAGASAAAFDDRDEVIRNLHNWRNKAAVPRSSSIEKYFREGMKPEFRGAFDVDANASFESALAFVARRGLDADSLRREIPIPENGILEEILARRSNREVEGTFVTLLTRRYGSPSLSVIRQRLKVARLVQDTYMRLRAALNPEVDEFHADPFANKVIQLVNLLCLSYNATVEAHRKGGSIAEQDAAFESAIPPWLAVGPFLAILPSSGKDAVAMVATQLSRVFMRSGEQAELPDYLLLDADCDWEIAKRMTSESREDEAIKNSAGELVDRARTHSPWRTFRTENRYWVMYDVVMRIGPIHQRALTAIQRLRELAQSPFEKVRAIAFELHALIEGDSAKDGATESRAEVLLEEARASPAFDRFEALILSYDAKHQLSQNNFTEAESRFRDALEASTRRSYGTLRGEIAGDLFATAIVNRPVNENNHASYLRDMVEFGAFEADLLMYPTIGKAAEAAREHFWSKLYRPYLAHRRRERKE